MRGIPIYNLGHPHERIKTRGERGGGEEGMEKRANTMRTSEKNVLNCTQVKIRCCLCVTKVDRQKLRKKN